MNVINTIDIKVVSLLILAFIYANTNKRAERAFTQHKLFKMMIVILAFLLVCDGTSRVVDGLPGKAAYYANWASNLLLFLGVPFAQGSWALYADYQIYHDEQKLKRYIIPFLLYFTANGAFALSSLSTGWFFTVDADNVYHRGPLFLLHPLVCYTLLLYTFAVIAINRKRIDRKHYASMMLFIVPPIVGGVLQSLFYGLTLILSSITLSMLLLYFNIQDKRLDTDYLTGVYNRRLLDSYLKDRINDSSRRRTFSAILVDLDGFKDINDRHGHITGDTALLDAVQVLKNCLRDSDFVARYGGDEFLAILDIGSQDVLEEAVGRIRSGCETFNGESGRPYRLSFSAGYAVYRRDSGMGAAEFLRQIDRMMYEDKRRADGAKPDAGSLPAATPC